MTGLSLQKIQLPRLRGTLSIPDLDLRPGETHTVYGLAGSGAEDLLYLVAGLREPLVQSAPAQDGKLERREIPLPPSELEKVLLGGVPLFQLDLQERARRVGYIFQNPEWSTLGGTVLEEFWFSFAAAGLQLPAAFRLRDYGLGEKLNQATDTLSGGEMQRLNCALVFESHRDLIVVDFSRSNLDKDFEAAVAGWIAERASRGAIVVTYGMRPGDALSSSSTIVVADGVVSRAAPPFADFPSRSEEGEQLRSRLAPRHLGESVLTTDELLPRFSTSPLTCSVKRGEIVRLTGPNGSGKTVFGRLIADQGQPWKGSYELSDGALPAMALQHPEHSFFGRTIHEELSNASLLSRCGLVEGDGGRHPRSLSISKKKLLSVAVALSLSRKLAILDEPTCGMDFPDKLRFIELLNEFREIAIIIITHDCGLVGVGRDVAMGGKQ